jgi:type II secretory pathway pseudopilin PulG
MPTILRIAVVAGILAGWSATAGAAEAKPALLGKQAVAHAGEKPKPRITISKQTTYLTGPLRPDGYVDYVGALNAELGRGVAPEDNAAVSLVLAFGPKEIGEKQRGAFFKLLGVPVPPEKGPYFVSLDQYVARLREAEKKPTTPADTKESQEMWAQLEQAQTRPWSKEEFPEIAGWLEANHAPLRRIEEAAGRPRYYAPLVPSGDPPMISVLLPICQESRNAARLLAARAMFRLHDGKVGEAWQDLLACHGLARQQGQGFTLVEGLVAIVIEEAALRGDAALAHYGRPTAAQVRQMKADLAALPPMPRMADCLDHGERFMYLDTVSSIARLGLSHLDELAGTDVLSERPTDLFKGIALEGLSAMIDWGEPLRLGNQWYDRLAAAARKPTRAERTAAMAACDKDIKALAAGVRDPKRMAERFLERMPRQAAGRWIGEVFVSLLMPAVSAVTKAEDRSAAETKLRDVALALAAYRADHGKYPDRLADLKPKYRTETKDPFSDGDLIYRPAADGFLLYSVGPNGKDDGGRNRSDYGNDPSPPPDFNQWDDLAIRMPVPQRKDRSPK